MADGFILITFHVALISDSEGEKKNSNTTNAALMLAVGLQNILIF